MRPYQALAKYSQGKVEDYKSERTFTNTPENPHPLLLSSITPRPHLPRILPVQLDFIRVLQELPGLPLDHYGRDCRQCRADTRSNVKSIQFSLSLIDEECVNCLKYTLPPNTHTHMHIAHTQRKLYQEPDLFFIPKHCQSRSGPKQGLSAFIKVSAFMLLSQVYPNSDTKS